ncbi:MAG: HAMP domain-containing protein [Bryobacteraceae bacterium]|nr:HAMP domain-containing protein [Bryobacteraceae bacterium]
MPSPITRTLDADLLLETLVAFKKGDFSVRLPVNQIGIAGKIADALNDIFDMNAAMVDEFARISRVVGKEGNTTERASLAGGRGEWASCIQSVNSLVSDLVQPSTEIARVIGAVAQGDLSQKMSLDVEGRALKGEFLRTARVVNTMVDQLNSFASEVTRVAREVGTEGKLGGQAVVTGVAGTWKDLTDSVNSMAGNLTNQVRNIAEVTTAVANGDLSRKITVNVQGEILELKNTINTMVDQLSSFASEVTRVAKEVGTEGKLGGQAEVKDVAGVWKDLTDSVNSMAGNLTNQVRNIAEVTTAVANGNLSRKITVDVRGEILELKNTINTMVDQLSSFASEVTRVAREVGTEGKLGGQADVKGVAGTWKDLTDSVNLMAGNLTGQVRNIAEVTTAVAKGDLSRKITVNVQGDILELKNTINTMVDQLSSFASEVTRVAREVGTEGKLGVQADVRGVGGVWKDLTDNVNLMASNLTVQLRDVSKVATAIANGDLTQKITVDVRGEILQIKEVINTMVDQLNAFAGEDTRVAREVGTEGKLGGQAQVKGVGGVWKDLTDSVNLMASNLTVQLRDVSKVATAIANGDLTQKITVDVSGEILQIKDVINTMLDQLNAFASEVTRVAREVGTEGELGGQAQVKGVGGVWKDLTDSVNSMAGNLTAQVRNIAEVTTAVANGDLSRKITVDVRGEILELKNTINTMVDQLSSFASEVTRVAREVGTEGKLGGQAVVKGVGGVWKDLTDSVNSMASNLTNQVRNIAEVTTAVARGDLSRKITVEVRGEILELKNTINTMVDQLSSFASEVTRVAREVGTEGKLGGQADVKGVAGTWRDLTESVNSMASNLTNQVRNIAEVTTAVARGDLSRKITVEVRGEILELKNTINTMVDQLNAFASEVTRVAREVGTEGRLGGQADVRGVAGTWRDLTDSVNSMGSNLTNQVRNIAQVTTAVAKGDLTTKITVDARGEILELKNTINTMVDQLSSFASEVTRVAREVGTEGKLGGQADVRGVAGTWKDLTDSVNSMASNLTNQVRNIAQVTTAVAKGDLTTKITVDARGEILELKNTINIMVDQLNAFASEVTRVAREVGTEGKLGGQADVRGVAGTWKDLTESVNSMASNLTAQVRNIADVTTAVAKGDLSRKITVDARGEILALKDTINTMVDQLSSFASEVTRVAREVGTEGRLGGQADVYGVAGTWKDLTESVNSMASNLTNQVRNIAQVTTAVAMGDLSRKITVDVRGEILELKNTVNTMVDQLNSFASEVTRVAREVGTEGKLGGQAEVRGVAGTWKDLTDNVNLMAANLTTQVRGIAKVVTAVANGDLKRKLVLETKGEIAELADTINAMIDTLATFADQVSTVAREVGTEGKLGGQARVPGAAGIWLDLTNNVNQLTTTLTNQVRAIAEVATAVTKGDLTRSITVEAQGEVAALKDNINEMIVNLAETTRKNTDQDWLKTNIAKFTRMVQGQRDLFTVAQLLLSELTPLVGAQRGTFYITDQTEGMGVLKFLAGYAYDDVEGVPNQFRVGQGLVGQCAREKVSIVVKAVPSNYIKIRSSLGAAAPATLVVLPVLFEGEVKAVVEFASLQQLSDIHLAFLEQLTESMGIVLNTIAATMHTEQLLKQSKALAEELQNTNEELQEKAQLLAEQNTEVEAKNKEIEQAKQALEEKAEQLALTSKYKSEFLANMSHELRTPLNNLLILARMLADNADGNLNPKQVKYAENIHSSGTDLLALINDILDLSKIESGKMDVEVGNIRFTELEDYCSRTFRHVADGKGLEFTTELDSSYASEVIRTDAKRLQQVLKNLLSNALKFTERGSVRLRIERVTRGWSPGHPVLARAKSVVAFSVTDTGIGIAPEKQKIIFEAFQQADGTTSRRYGGTGLGLSISRELARLLGGEIRLQSTPQQGSTFTLYLPQAYISPAPKIEHLEPHAFVEADRKAALAQPESASVDIVLEAPGQVSAQLVEEMVVDDDRNLISPSERPILIVEDDVTFARILVEVAHKHNLKALVALRGGSAIALAREHRPAAITLDIRLPDMSGWALIDRLKHTPETRHIPVHMISAHENTRRGFALGASSCLQKGLSKEDLDAAFRVIVESTQPAARRLGIIVQNPRERTALLQALPGPDLEVVELSNSPAPAEIVNRGLDGLLLDPRVEGSLELAETLHRAVSPKPLPMVFYSRKLSETALNTIQRLSMICPVRHATTLPHCLDAISLLLHRPEDALSEEQRNMLAEARQMDALLAGRKVLVIDDDLRNIFALTSVLEQHNLTVVHAENGRAGIELLQQTKDIDLVLTDIMMPEMDGYETMGAIRKLPDYASLPIIALTAKAMKGDRDKCLRAGASDYVTKPVDLDHLFAVMRVCLSRLDEEVFASGRPLPPRLSEEDFTLEDDRAGIQPADNVVLLIEDNITFARILVDMCHQRGMKALVALNGNAAIALALEFRPKAITLDVGLPDLSGWSLLDRLKHDPLTRHIPVHLISGHENNRLGFALGAASCMQKAVSKESLEEAFASIRRSLEDRSRRLMVLLPEADRDPVLRMLAGPDLEVRTVLDPATLLRDFPGWNPDAVILDPNVPAIVQVIEQIQAPSGKSPVPVLLYGKSLSTVPASELQRLTRTGPVRYARTVDRLLDATVLALHRRESALSDTQRAALKQLRAADPMLAGRRVLVIDDDARNIYALTSVLSQKEIAVISAENGRAGIEMLMENPETDLVLMDIMMPEMDGYKTTRAIREIPSFASLPIIALTAKAMKGDREKCIEAGASDYIPKPVDVDQLFSAMRVCLAQYDEQRPAVTETPGT